MKIIDLSHASVDIYIIWYVYSTFLPRRIYQASRVGGERRIKRWFSRRGLEPYQSEVAAIPSAFFPGVDCEAVMNTMDPAPANTRRWPNVRSCSRPNVCDAGPTMTHTGQSIVFSGIGQFVIFSASLIYCLSVLELWTALSLKAPDIDPLLGSVGPASQSVDQRFPIIGWCIGSLLHKCQNL